MNAQEFRAAAIEILDQYIARQEAADPAVEPTLLSDWLEEFSLYIDCHAVMLTIEDE